MRILAWWRRPDMGRQAYPLYSYRGTCAARCGARFGCTVQRRSAHLLLLDATVPLIVGAVITLGGVLHGGGSVRPAAVAVGLGAAASLLARRRAPGWTLAASGGLTLVQFHIDPAAAATTVVAPAVALYALALTRGRREQLLAAVAAVAAVVIAEALHAGGPTLLQTLGHVLLIAIPLLAAQAHRTRHAYVSLLRERLELSERTREQEVEQRAAQERMRIARDVHDVVAHTLTTINVQAATAAELLDRDPGHARAALETIEEASRDAIGELRAILGILRDDSDGQPPLAPAPGVGTVAELIQRTRAAGLDVQLGVSGERPERLPDTVSLAAFRIVQESITNACRHSAGAPVCVTLSFEPGRLVVAIENGAGTPSNGNGSTPGVGIVGMTERASAVGGTLHAGPLPGGFRVEAELPYTRASV
jgi:signal transduction histidine kinase